MTSVSLKQMFSLQTAWHYARPEFLYLSWAVMEVALIAPVTLTIMPWARFWAPAAFTLWMLLIILIPFNLSRLMSLRAVSLFRQQNLLLLAFLVAVLLSLRLMLYPGHGLFSLSWLRELGGHFATARHPFLRRDLLIFILLSVLWWRGLSLAGRRVDINDLGLRVRVGALIVAPFIIVLSQLRLPWSVAVYLLVFLLAGLIAISLTRAEQIEQERTGQNYPMSPRWLAIVIGTSAGIALIAGIIAGLISGNSVPVILRWLSPVGIAIVFSGTVIFTAMTFLLLPILAVVEQLAFFINNLLGRQFSPDAQPQAQADDAGAVAEQFDALIKWLTDPQTTLSFVINRLLLFLLLVIIMGLVLLLLDRFFKRRRLAARDGDEAAFSHRSEVDLDDEGLGRRFLRRLGLMNRLRAASVRRLYHQMSRAAATHGYSRAHSETPYEYQATLFLAWPDGREETTMLTEAYVRVRYGEVPETREELVALRAAWRRLEKQKPADIKLQAQ